VSKSAVWLFGVIVVGVAVLLYACFRGPTEAEVGDVVARAIEETLLNEDFGGREVVLDSGNLARLSPEVSDRVESVIRQHWPTAKVMDLHESFERMPGAWLNNEASASGTNTTHVLVLFSVATRGRTLEFGWRYRFGAGLSGGNAFTAEFRWGAWGDIKTDDVVVVRRATAPG
jgi:hypothetical protein